MNVQSPAGRARSEPLVSIVMNCYNGGKYLAHAIDSVLAQTYSNWELVFWDNQSSDDSAAIFRRYTDARLKYYRAPEHTLLYAARNEAMRHVHGDFVAFLDVDDWWEPLKLEKQIPLFADPEVGIVCGNYWIVDERRGGQRKFLDRDAPTGFVVKELLRSYYVGMLTLVVRRSAMDSLSHGFDPRYHIIGDSDLVIRMAAHWKVDCVQQPIAYCRLHATNESLNNKQREVEELECWTREIAQSRALNDKHAYLEVQNHLHYFKGMLAATKGDSTTGFSMWSQLPWGRYKLKLLVALLLPAAWLERLRQ
jgi:glycosyltransferase involved in cell wall biosynthesis